MTPRNWGLRSRRLVSATALAVAAGLSLGGAALAESPSDACAAVAASPFEADHPGGVLQVDPATAVAPCEAAVEAAPDDLRAKVWLARAYLAADRAEEAIPLLEAGVAAGDPLAQQLLGDLLSRGTQSIGPDPDRAYDLLRASAGQGFAPGQAGFGSLFEDGELASADLPRAARLYRLAADKGDPGARYHLGRFYELGQGGLATDPAKAAELYLAADADGEPRAAEALGNLYLEGTGVDRDPARALAFSQKAADAGLADAENRVGYIYAEGVGVKRDWATALGWFEKAADQDHPLAVHNVVEVRAEIACAAAAASQYEADFAAVGKDFEAIDPATAVPACQDAVDADPGSDEDKAWLARALLADHRPDEARPLLETAVAGDSLLARQLLGDDLHGDFGGTEDDARALEVLRPAADAGFAPAQLSVGWAYQRGLGTDPDVAAAVEWYRKAAAQGLPRAMANLGYLYHGGVDGPPDYAEAMRWYQAAADKGDVVGIYGVGQLYEFGQGVTQDYAKAVENFTRAADMGDAAAQNDLGYLYDTGQGVAEDPEAAARYYQKAADQDYALAKANLALLLNTGRGVEADAGRAFELNREAHDAGQVEGTVGLAEAYLDGTVVDYDPSEARYYAETASEQGDAYGQNLYGYLLAEGLGGVRDFHAALDQFQLAADQGIDTAVSNAEETKAEIACSEAAASPHEAGFESTGKALADIDPQVAIPACQAAVDHDPESVEDKAWLARALISAGRGSEAEPLLEPSVDAGFAPGMTLLADLVQLGVGTDRDPARGYALLKTAAAAGFAPAELGIGKSWELGLGVAPDAALAAKWYRKAAADGVAEAADALAAMSEPAPSEPASGLGRAEARL